MKKFFEHEAVKRAIRTFFQAAIGYIAIALPNIDLSNTSMTKTALIGVGMSAVAAGLAAVMNLNDRT